MWNIRWGRLLRRSLAVCLAAVGLWLLLAGAAVGAAGGIDEGVLASAYSPEWTAEFFFRHFRGTVIDWILHEGGYPLWDKLSQDYVLFEQAFRA